MTIVRPTSRLHSVPCPLNSAHIIARDASAWKVHMMAEHGANADSWDAWGLHYAEGRGGFRDPKVGNIRVYPQHMCYGCWSSFETEADLLTHLSTVHDAE